ncbi:hypothetical protein N0V90_008381 [Kalmusia sp. IMI 367209]|nr:hypothetical protein N0V90_008381 [Kalmusia sp. IMI 367209]
MPVTKNLLMALKQLRDERQNRTLWVDAICIDQVNIEERGQQVSLMKDIFQQSKRTVVWLGEEDGDSHCAMELIRHLARMSRERSAQNFCKSHESDYIPPLYDPVWRAFALLIQRPWFHRTWVVSEVSVALDVQELLEAVQYAVGLGVFIAYGGSTTYQALRLSETRAHFQQGQSPPLYEALLNNRSFLATDPRDKIYGVLSLASKGDVEAMGVQADYRLSVQELYKKITRSLLERPGLDAFSASRAQSNDLKSTLPSWITDWAASDPSVPLNSTDFLENGDSTSFISLDSLDYNSAASTTSSSAFDDSKNLLGLEGVLIDEVETVGVLSRTRYLRRVSHMFELFVQCHDILEQLKNWEKVARTGSRTRYPTGESSRLAYWKTLCAGRVPGNLTSVTKDPRFKYYLIIRSLRLFVRATIRCVPRNEKDTWYNRLFYSMFQTAWRTFGLTPAKIQRIGFPPESRLSNYRRMVRTQKGYLALAPRSARVGDWIGVFKGGKMPLVVRKKGEHWILLGESYVHGIMKGEAWDEAKCERMWFE